MTTRQTPEGYAHELTRRMSGFSNFAISFFHHCILAGGITSFQAGFSGAGGASIAVAGVRLDPLEIVAPG